MSTKVSNIVVIGSICLDEFLQVAPSGHAETESGDYIMLKRGDKIAVSSLEHFPGGGAMNIGTGLSRLGLRVDLVSEVGSDGYARMLVDIAKRNGLGTGSIGIKDGDKTAKTTIIYDSGEESLLGFPGASMEINDELLSHALWKQGSSYALLVAPLHTISDKLKTLILDVATSGNFLILNPPHDIITSNPSAILQIAARSDVVVLNSREAELLAGAIMRASGRGEDELTIIESISLIHSLGMDILVVTDGKNGAYAREGKRLVHFPSLVQKIVDTTGCGDAFTSAFIWSLLRGDSIDNALIYGSISAKLVAGARGAQTALPMIEEIEEEFRSVDHSAIREVRI